PPITSLFPYTTLFRSDRDRERFLWLLEVAADRYRWEIHAYCLMTNHFHLLVTTKDPKVSAGMQYLNGRYCAWFNWRHGFEGHVVDRKSTRLNSSHVAI